jgi:molybdopterin-guanine dinucleotide biosynthesis protein A
MFFGHKTFVYDRGMDGVSIFVLAGGQSSRMGADKAFLEFRGSTLLERMVKLGQEVSSSVWIVGPRQKFAPFGKVVEDVYPGQGPLAGIQAALRASEDDLNVMLAVDLPFIESGLIRYLLVRAQDTDALAIVPRAGGGWQPLCAVYRKPFADLAEKALHQSENKIDLLFGKVAVRAIEESELRSAGFSPEMFRNLNTPEDLKRGAKAPRDGKLTPDS